MIRIARVTKITKMTLMNGLAVWDKYWAPGLVGSRMTRVTLLTSLTWMTGISRMTSSDYHD